MEHGPLEEHFGEGIAKPIRLAKRVGRFCLRLLNPYYPASTLEGKIPFEDESDDVYWERIKKLDVGPEVEPMAHDLFDREWQPPLWEGLPYYHGKPANETAPNGQQAVFNKEEFNRRLDEQA